ncbi:MAG: FAD-dependent oxidoreductase, partial [Victivallales bacterium]
NSMRVVDCACVVDASGGGNITAMAGGKVHYGENGRFQPLSLIFRMANVEFEPFLRFIRDNPSEGILGENPVLGKNPSEAAEALYAGGLPYVAVSSGGKIMGKAVREKTLHPCTAAFITPVSVRKKEICVNATRISGIDSADDLKVSAALMELSEQTVNLLRFFREKIPGFERACISAAAHRVGIRESGRIDGEYSLRQDEVINAVRHSDYIARGCHHVDIHGEGTAQIRIPVKNGQTYDIAYQCLLPKGLKNIIAAGRCLSSDRGANGSARVMGTCIATGQAAGAAAAIFVKEDRRDFRDIEPAKIRAKLNCL